MGVHIMKQSNGKFCRWSSVTDSFTHFNYTRAEMFRDLKAHHLAGWAVEMNERLDRAEATGDSARWGKQTVRESLIDVVCQRGHDRADVGSRPLPRDAEGRGTALRPLG